MIVSEGKKDGIKNFIRYSWISKFMSIFTNPIEPLTWKREFRVKHAVYKTSHTWYISASNCV